VIFILSLFLFGVFCFAHISELNPNDALKKLYEGNVRYVKCKLTHSNLDGQRRKETTTGGQHPFAIVVSCSDSRVSVAHIFDVGVGDIFSIRVAGNLSGVDQIASVEYAVNHLGTPSLVILGHTHCGAVAAAVSGAKVHGSLPWLLDKIKPAICKVKENNPGLPPDEFVSEVIKENVWHVIEDMIIKSPEIKGKLKVGKLGIVGAMYDIETGAVTWMGAHPDQAELMK
jgi:carbonic anhydrase